MIKNIYGFIRKQYKKIVPYKTLNNSELETYYVHHQWCAYKIEWDKYSLEIQKKFNHLNTTKEEEYIFHYTSPCIIEPDLGWGMTTKNELILESVPGNDWKYRHKWPHHPLPNKFDKHFKWSKKTNFEEIIYLNFAYNFGKNYYHFFIDLVGQIFLLKKQNITLNLPIVVHKNIFETKFFSQTLEQSSFLKSLNWQILDNSFIKAKKAWFVKSTLFQPELHKFILDEVFSLSPNNSTKNNKVFITRNSKRVRTITNIKEIEHYLQNKGFEIIDCDNMSVLQQIEIFRDTGIIIAIHGAGLTNMIFRYPQKMKVIEILPSNYIAQHYICLANMCGFEYQCVIGNDLNKEQSFYLPIEQFEGLI